MFELGSADLENRNEIFIGGRVFTKSLEVIENVSVNGDKTSANGVWELAVQKNTNLTLEITKELDNTKDISSGDALDALRLAVSLPTQAGTKSAFDYISADFNRDGKVTSSDALDILKYAVGLPTTEQSEWVFVDTNGDYSGVSKSNTNYTEGVSIDDLTSDMTVDLTGILIGDVNDSYSGLIV